MGGGWRRRARNEIAPPDYRIATPRSAIWTAGADGAFKKARWSCMAISWRFPGLPKHGDAD